MTQVKKKMKWIWIYKFTLILTPLCDSKEDQNENIFPITYRSLQKQLASNLRWSTPNKEHFFLTFPACFSIPIIFSNLNSNCSNLLHMRNLQEQVKRAFCYQNLFWPFTVWLNCSYDLKNFTRIFFCHSSRSQQFW